MKHILLTIFFFPFFFSSQAQQWEPVKDTLFESEDTYYTYFVHHKNFLYFFTDNEIFKSPDHGEHWEPIKSNQSLFYTTVFSNGQYLFTTDENRAIIKSTDGEIWTPLSLHFDAPQLLTSIDNRLFISEEGTNRPKSIHYSDDGETWHEIASNIGVEDRFIGARSYPLCFIDSYNNLFYLKKDSSLNSIKISRRERLIRRGAYLFSRTNYSDISNNVERLDLNTFQWTTITSSLDSIADIIYLDTLIFVKTRSKEGHYKILRSSDFGTEWTVIKSGKEAEESSLRLHYSHAGFISGPNLLFGFWISRDSGLNWTFNRREYYGKQKIYFTGKNLFVDSPSGVSVSKNMGKTWEAVSLPDTLLYPNKFFLLKEGHAAITAYDGLIYYSDNHGESWTHIKTPPQFYEFEYNEERHQGRDIISIKLIDDYLTVRVDKITIDAFITREFKTKDNGTTWTEISNLFPVQSYSRESIMPYFNKDSILYGVHVDGIALLISNSKTFQWTWFNANEVLPANYSFEQIFDGRDKVFVTAFTGGGLQSKTYKLYEVSEDGSLKELPNENMPEPPFSYIHTTDSCIYIVGRKDIRKLKPNDDTWTTLSTENLPDNIVTTNAVFYDGTIYLATENGIFKLDEAGTLAIKNSSNNGGNALLYPNPAKESFLLNFPNNMDTPKSITIYDLRGRELKRFEYINNEDYDISELQKGLYVVHLVYATKRATIKLAKE